jgi:hypothetical protein
MFCSTHNPAIVSIPRVHIGMLHWHHIEMYMMKFLFYKLHNYELIFNFIILRYGNLVMAIPLLKLGQYFHMASLIVNLLRCLYFLPY